MFFDRKPAQEKPWTSKLWIYDLRTNQHFTLKENTVKRTDLDDFVASYFGGTSFRTSPDLRKQVPPGANRHERKESERFKSYTYEELTKRDKVNLDIFWLKDESLEDSANLLGSVNPSCPASLGTLKVSVPPAVKLAAAACPASAKPRRQRQPKQRSDVRIQRSGNTEDLEAALAQFAGIASDLRR